jgi:hypothetical protein
LSADPWLLEPACPPSARPEKLFDPMSGVDGLRAAQTIVGPPRTLEVWLYQAPPPALADPSVWSLDPPPGGALVSITAAAVAPNPTPHLTLTLAGLPEPARYRLLVEPPNTVPFDPLRTWLPVRLRPECDDLGSCFPVEEPPPTPHPSPVLDYRARDWRGLRQALVEYLLRRDPDADVSPADPTITLIELFAHVGDLLNYQLDRVATEAYLGTSRLRTSVKRHARLVDYAVADGAAAETYVHVALAPKAPPISVKKQSVAVDVAQSDLAFTLEHDLTADASLGEIPLYDWGEAGCCLPAGATECVLVRPKPADALGDTWLGEGDLLVFEVVDPDDATRHLDWAHRVVQWPRDASGNERFRAPLPSRDAQVVRVSSVDKIADPLLGSTLPLFRVRWQAEDALLRDYPVGVDTGAGEAEVTVARANLVPAHHGRLVDGAPGETVSLRAPAWADADTASPVEFSLIKAGTPVRGRRDGGPGIAFAPIRLPDRPEARPHRLDVSLVLPSSVTVPATQLGSLLDARAGEYSFVVDVEEEEPPIMRFSTGPLGLAPPLRTKVSAAYEVGGGTRGNIPANALRLLEENTNGPGQEPVWEAVDGVVVRNPVPAVAGADPTPLDVVRRDAPEAFAVEPRRAVLPADHAAAVAGDPLVQRAMAQRAWSGSWPVIATVVDLEVAGDQADEARAKLQAHLDDMRMLGTEVAVVSGTAVGLLITLEVCLRPGFDPESVRAEILRLLRPGTDERPGLFHASRLQLGSAVYLSGVVAAVAALSSVDAVEVLEARRLSDPPSTVRTVITVAPDEVAVLDDDPAQPERGRLDIRVRGGR